MRVLVVGLACVVLAAGCGGHPAALPLRSVEAAVRAAGYGRLHVADASVEIARAKASGLLLPGTRSGTPDVVQPLDVPVVLVLRYPTANDADATKPPTIRICNVVVVDLGAKLKAAQEASSRIISELRKRCH